MACTMNRKSIKFKLIAFTASATFLVLLFCGLLSSFYFLDLLRQQVIRDEQQKLNQAAVRIADIQEEMMKLAQAIAADPEIQKQTAAEAGQDVLDFLSARQRLGSVLSRYLNIRQDSYSAYLITDRTTYFSSGLETDENMGHQEWYRSMKGNGFTGVHEIYENKSRSMNEVISYVMEFYDMRNGTDSLGKIVINVEYDEIRKNLMFGDAVVEHYRLTDESGSLLWSCHSSDREKETERMILISQEIPMQDGWTLTAAVSGHAIIQKLKYIFIFFGVMFLSALILLCLVLFRTVSRVLRPIDLLVEGAREVGNGNLDFAVSIDTEDEFRRLGDTFNTMVGDIRNHMERSVAYEKAAKEMELNRLMLQINPHFIYNTLNSIVYMAQMKENQDIVIFTKAFISLLHDTLNVDKDEMYITLEQELKNVKNYLTLQSYRYTNRFTAVYEIDDSTLSCLVPNVLIQPLAENAVFHGICAKPGRGSLLIKSQLTKDGHVEITVADDGAGMSQEKAENLLKEDIRIRGGMRKIGIANVKERIHYIYGEDYGMVMKSEEGRGTEIVIRIPFLSGTETE